MFADESSKIYLPPNFQPSSRDVICARGKQAFLHPGNKRFREIIAMNITSYASAESKNEKSSIVWRIIEDVGTGANGGFVKYCSTQKLWYRLGDAASKEKVGQTIRELITQKDPEKKEKKRVKRAVNKAKRVAVTKWDAADLEPIPVPGVVNASRDNLPQWPSNSLGPDCVEMNDENVKSASLQLMLDLEPIPVKFHPQNHCPPADSGLLQMAWAPIHQSRPDMLHPTKIAVEPPRSYQSPQRQLDSISLSEAMSAGVSKDENLDGIDGETLLLRRHHYLPYSNLEAYTDFRRHT